MEGVSVKGEEGTALDHYSHCIVAVHGGPHSCTPSSFIAMYTYLAWVCNAAILHVNYRGSTGFGQGSIDSLLGKIGSNDVGDVMQAVSEVTNDRYNEVTKDTKMCIVGGSHGGFLTAHLIGQYPDFFTAACLRNPVINLPSMANVTDIPDWCHVEAKGAGKFDFGTYQAITKEVSCLVLMWVVADDHGN
jgi:acylaminoacyl-peptidase